VLVRRRLRPHLPQEVRRQHNVRVVGTDLGRRVFVDLGSMLR
jgi:hypothetical protein